MKVLHIFLTLWAILMPTQGNPQVFYAPFGRHLDSSGRQYYTVEYIGNSPQQGKLDYNLNHGDVDAPIYDDEDGDDVSGSVSYSNGLVQIANSEDKDSLVMPGVTINEGSVVEYETVDDDDNNGYDDEEDNEDTNEMENVNQSSLDTKTNETIPSESSTTESDIPEEDTESLIELETTPDISSNTSVTPLNQTNNPAFVHPIYRPSSEWPLKVEESSNSNTQKDEEPLKKRIRKPKPKKGYRLRIVKRKGNQRRKNVRRPIGHGLFKKFNRSFGRANSKSGPKPCGNCQCGLTTTRRMIDGEVVAVNELPWLAMITYNNTIQCAGTLINDRYVLTAAHCVLGFDRKLFELRFLEYDTINSMETVSLLRNISRVHSLETYDPKKSEDDIAILRLSKPIDFETTTIRPVCLPTNSIDLTGQTGVIAGWGLASDRGTEVNITLQATEVPILSNQQCLLVGMKITDKMMCSGRLLDGEIKTCQGDSGGPLMVIKNKRHVLAGVTSWGDGCAKPLKPGVYTRITKYLQWINKQSSGSCKCK